MSDGRRFRIPAVVDDFTRECLCLVADISLSGRRIAQELDIIAACRGWASEEELRHPVGPRASPPVHPLSVQINNFYSGGSFGEGRIEYLHVNSSTFWLSDYANMV